VRGKGCGVCDVVAGRGPVDPLSLLKARALWMVVDEDLLIRCRCWLWWVCGWLWLVVCDAGLVAEAKGLLWRCR